MSKGSKVRPTNKVEYDKNYDTIFGRKYTAPETEEFDMCPYCGIRAEDICDTVPAAECEKAINLVHGAWLKDLNDKD